jgi:hypothetical protein
MKIQRAWYTLVMALGAVSHSSVAQPSITWLGNPGSQYSPIFPFFANLSGITEDGSTVVHVLSDVPEPYLWRRGQGWLLYPGGRGYGFVDISGNGTTIAGVSAFNCGDPDFICNYPAYYEQSSWFNITPPFDYRTGFATAISESGDVLVGGFSKSVPGVGTVSHPFRWQRNAGISLLSLPPEQPRLVYAMGVSPDGSVVVGTAAFEDTVPVMALRWDSATGAIQILPKLNSEGMAWATDASTGGSVIVGGCTVTTNIETIKPVRWTSNTSLQVLPTGSLPAGTANCVTRNGAVITGTVIDFSNQFGVAARWGACGFEDLNLRYANLLSAGERLFTAHILSRSGRFVGGIGTRDGQDIELYVIDTDRCWDPPGNVDTDCCVDDADLLLVLFDFGSEGQYRPTDLNCDGIVDDADLLIVLFNFGTGC